MKTKASEQDPDLPDEIDFDSPEARRTGVRGKYAKNHAKETTPVAELDDMLDDYSSLDWSKAERGKYIRRQG